MKRRSKAAGKAVKGATPQDGDAKALCITQRMAATATLRARLNCPRAVAGRRSRGTTQETETAHFTRERDEGREREKATVEISRAIASSPLNAQVGSTRESADRETTARPRLSLQE